MVHLWLTGTIEVYMDSYRMTNTSIRSKEKKEGRAIQLYQKYQWWCPKEVSRGVVLFLKRQ